MSKTIDTAPLPVLQPAHQVPECLLRALIQKKPLSAPDASHVLGIALQKIAESLQAQACGLLLHLHSAQRLQILKLSFSKHGFGLDTARHVLLTDRAAQLESMVLPLDHTIAASVLAAGNAVVVPDRQSIPDFFDPFEFAPEFLVQSLVVVPLRAGAHTLGFLEAINKSAPEDGREFSANDVEALRDAATFVLRYIQRMQDPDAQLNQCEVAQCMARLSKCGQIALNRDSKLDTELLATVGEKTLRRYRIVPLARLTEKSVRAALENPLDYQLIQDFEIVTGLKIAEKFIATLADIDATINHVFSNEGKMSNLAESLAQQYMELEAASTAVLQEEEDENSALIVRLAHRVIADAASQGASDIHIEPQAGSLIVRYRIDGVCRAKFNLPLHVHRALIARIKIMADLDIAEHRLPQDGRIYFTRFSAEHQLDLRVSIAPMAFGESAVLRILDKKKSHLPLSELGFSAYNLEHYRKLITLPHGMILHTGPTGSGKSMTLFAALNEINSPESKILTAEDPIEYTLQGINQMQMHRTIGLTFASALRCFLRQDPDIILVGEIRDKETAEISIEAALTGHLLFSTLHTNDASSTITRLGDMGVEEFLISTTLAGICAQRLMRRLCSCKVAAKPEPRELALLQHAKSGPPAAGIFRPGACRLCENTGYKGRVGIHELLVVTKDLRELIAAGANAEELKASARRSGMRTLFEDAMEKVNAGVTSLEEATTIAIADEESGK